MKEYKLIFSSTEPNVRNCVWVKPVSGGFALYMLSNGVMSPLKVMDDNSTANIADDVVQNLVGSVQDGKTANTINGAKAYAEDVKDTVTGTDADTSADLTLYGLKAYIDEKTT